MDSILGDSEQDQSEQNERAELFAERFEIIEELGCGGMSVVYRAREVLLDRKVAIKVLHRSFARDQGSLQRFGNEARACSGLAHPNIVQILSFGVTKDEQPFIIMELLEGKTLEQELKDHGAFEQQKFAAVFLPVLDALVYAHERNIVHRDLKPSNLMLLRDRGGSRQVKVKVLDFGIAKVLENEDKQDRQATVGLLGSPLYMSPEQCSGARVDQRSDIYSLACVMYEAIVGKPPFSGDTPLETMYEHLKRSVPRLVEVSGSLNIPQALFDVIIEALAKDPAKRVKSMAEFRDKVAAALTKTEVMARQKAARLASSSQILFYVLMTVALVFVAVRFSVQLRTQNDSWVPKKIISSPSNIDEMVYLRRAQKLRTAGNYQAALEMGLLALKEASAVKQEHPGWLCSAHIELAAIYAELHEAEKAEKEYLAAIAVFTTPTSAGRLNAVDYYCSWLIDQGKEEKGLNCFRKALHDCEQYLDGDADHDVGVGYKSFAEQLYYLGKYRESAWNARKGLSHFDRLPGQRNEDAAVCLTFRFYLACKKLGKAEEGLAEIKQTSALLQEESLPDETAYFSFASMADENGLKDEALKFYKLCIKYAHHTSPLRAKQILKAAETAIARLDKKSP